MVDQDLHDVDVLIIGAGLSGIAAGAHLKMQCPEKSFALLEQRQAMGGTWDLFKYPGVRSDSDMHTLGYRFKPWLHEKAIADGPSIHAYVNETAKEYGLTPLIKFGHRMLHANWSSAAACWTVTARREADGAEVIFRANFLFMCAGYYNYDQGYRPEFPNEAAFTGDVIHPQHWPEKLDYADKKIVVIGSGATAVTIVPVMAKLAAKVTMLQRSPTYMISQPSIDWKADLSRKIMPEKMAYALTRWRNINWQRFVYLLARKCPKILGGKLLRDAKKQLPHAIDFKKHFVPSYSPWEQRLCLVPDSNIFNAISSGKADIVTDHIDHFTASGIQLKSGGHIDADIIVTATGLNLVTMGQAELRVEGVPVNLGDHVNYKGVMFNDIPNLASVFGYVNASWTLKTDIVCDYVCNLLKTMDAKGAQIANPHLADADMPRLPFVENFSSGYFARSFDKLPKNGDRHPWRVLQDYAAEKKILTKEPVDDGIMLFSKAGKQQPHVIDQNRTANAIAAE
jgi:monooxygenase